MQWFKLITALGMLTALVYQWTSSGHIKQKINVEKLAHDLFSSNEGTQTAAAASIMYIAGVAELQPQLKEGGIIVPALVKLVSQAGVKDINNETLPICLLALAKLSQNDEETQELALQAGILPRLHSIFKAGNPAWQAAASLVLHSLSSHHQSEVQELLSSESMYVTAALNLLETGAYSNTTDVVVAANRLLQLLAQEGSTRAQLMERGVQRMLMQLLVTFNNQSAIFSSAAEVISELIDKERGLLEKVVEAGIVPPVLQELRKSSKHSVVAVLGLVARLVRDEAAHAELVSGGLLSMCGQMVFQGPAVKLPWRQACLDIVTDATQSQQMTIDPQRPYIAQRHLVGSIVRLAANTKYPALHNTLLETLRDMGVSRRACEALAEVNGVAMLLQILKRDGNATQLASEEKSWLLQSQRSASMLLALVALQPSLRAHVVEVGAIPTIATLVREYLKGPGMFQQVRVTAVAALVPILGEDQQYHQAVVLSGLLESLMHMYYSTHEAERQVAVTVMRVLAQQADVAAMYQRAGIYLDVKH